MGSLPNPGEIYSLKDQFHHPYRIVVEVKNRLIYYNWLIYDSEKNVVNQTYESNVVNSFLFYQIFSKSFLNINEFKTYFNVNVNESVKNLNIEDLF